VTTAAPAIDLDEIFKILSRQQIRSIVEADAPINIWEGSIRSGKTIASLLRWLMFVADPPPIGDLVMIGKTRETINRNLFGPLAASSLFGPLVDQVHYTAGAPTATILDRTIHVVGANDAKAESKIRGMTVAGAYVDEATVLPRDFFDQLVGRGSVTGSRIFATTNPDTPVHWLRKYYLQRLADVEGRSWHFNIYDNPHLDPAYVARLERTYVGLWHRRFIRGEWVPGEGAVFDMFDTATHVVPAAKVPRIHQWICCSLDYGTTNPFHAILLGLGEDRKLYVVGEYRHDSHTAQGSHSDVEHSEALRRWLRTFPVPGGGTGVDPEYIIVDPSAASLRQQLYRDGLAPQEADNAVLDGIRTLSSLFALKALLISDACPFLVDELVGYSWDPKATERGEDAPIKVNDHGVDALRYGAHTTRGIWHDLIAAVLDLAA